MKKTNKYLYVTKVYVNYGQGFELECIEHTYRDALRTRREYRENCPEYPVKLTEARIPNPDYVSAQEK